jgi:hypothetical protein
MSIRFSDQEDSKRGAQDFIVRQRVPSMRQLVALFLSALIIAISITVAVASKPALVAILFILTVSVGWYVVVQTQQTRDLLMTTEFQNALFSSALGLNHKFCLILKPDGTMVYLDRGFQDMFPSFLKQSQRHLALLLESGNVAEKDRESILAAVARGTPDKVIFSIRAGDGQVHRLMLNIDPLHRPTGFILLRGRDFVEQRSNNPQPGRVLAPQAAYITADLPPQPLIEDPKKKQW